MEKETRTFIVKREVYYTIEAKNEFHAENKVAKLNSDAEYAAENPVNSYVEEIKIAAVL